MVVLALLLLGLGVAACVIVAIQVTDPITLSLLGTSIDTSAREIFFAGAITGAVMAGALWLLKSSTTRAHRRRQEMKDLRRHRRTEVERLEAEKAELQAALDDQRTQTGAAASGPAEPRPYAPSEQRPLLAPPAATPARAEGPATRIDLTDTAPGSDRGSSDQVDLSKGATAASATDLTAAAPLGDTEGRLGHRQSSPRDGSTFRS